eukprot:2579010-Prorocentrum_lima.AAC.1
MSAKANFTQFNLHHALPHTSIHHPSLIIVSAGASVQEAAFSPIFNFHHQFANSASCSLGSAGSHLGHPT